MLLLYLFIAILYYTRKLLVGGLGVYRLFGGGAAAVRAALHVYNMCVCMYTHINTYIYIYIYIYI